MNIPKFYANVNKNMPPDYWDYENYEISGWGYYICDLFFLIFRNYIISS